MWPRQPLTISLPAVAPGSLSLNLSLKEPPAWGDKAEYRYFCPVESHGYRYSSPME